MVLISWYWEFFIKIQNIQKVAIDLKKNFVKKKISKIFVTAVNFEAKGQNYQKNCIRRGSNYFNMTKKSFF